MGENCRFQKTRARNISKTNLNLAIEIQTDQEENLIRELMAMDSVVSASLVEHDGEVTV